MIRDIIAKGIGFSPGSTKFIPVHGFLPASVVSQASSGGEYWWRRRLRGRVDDEEHEHE